MNEHTAFLKSVTLQKEHIPSFSVYPYCLPAIRTLQSLDFHPNVTFIIGENGTGKSTLLEAIAVALGFNAEKSHIYSLTQEGIRESELEETEHYQTVKLFFENRDRLFHHLFQS
ncbi:AAA family ATPase [Bacillus sp. JJ1127]|uniref:AAA family ATPase n=1 Tax=Bacillus sp. JJ1127 TaxID=3122952 RepID=UPI002FFE392C